VPVPGPGGFGPLAQKPSRAGGQRQWQQCESQGPRASQHHPQPGQRWNTAQAPSRPPARAPATRFPADPGPSCHPAELSPTQLPAGLRRVHRRRPLAGAGNPRPVQWRRAEAQLGPALELLTRRREPLRAHGATRGRPRYTVTQKPLRRGGGRAGCWALWSGEGTSQAPAPPLQPPQPLLRQVPLIGARGGKSRRGASSCTCCREGGGAPGWSQQRSRRRGPRGNERASLEARSQRARAGRTFSERLRILSCDQGHKEPSPFPGPQCELCPSCHPPEPALLPRVLGGTGMHDSDVAGAVLPG